MPITVTTPVGSLLAWKRDDITIALQNGAWWDEHLKQAMDDTPADGWALDLGANIGYFTRYLAGRFAHVLAVEAHPETATLLAYNVKDHKNVWITIGAAYDRTGVTLELAASHIHGWPEGERSFLDLDDVPHVGGFTFVEDPSQQHHLHEIKVQTVKVDDLVPPDVMVRLMKIDVQGATLRALHGAEETIARCRPRIIWEFEHHVSECRGDLWHHHVEFFNERQYDIEAIPGPWSDFLAVPR